MYNNFTFCGRLTKAPEIRKTNTNKDILLFSVAVQNNYNDSDGTRSAEFFDCISSKQGLLNYSKYLTKGDYILVSGELHTYTKNNVTRISVRADTIDLLHKASNNTQKESTKPNDGVHLSLPF